MGRPPLLYIAPDGLHGYLQRRHSGVIEHAGHFTPDPPGLQAFAIWLRAFKAGTAFSLLIDLPDERFKIETLPYVRGPDRRRLRERRQEQIFPDTPFVTHQYLERDASGRRDERILFMAQPRPATLSPWLDAIGTAGHMVRQLTPVSLLSIVLAQRLAHPPGPVLLASRTPAGRRISCIDGRRLLFSRLIAGDPAHTGTSIAAEILHIQQQLLGLRILSHGLPRTLLVIGKGADSAVPAAPDDGDDLTIIHVDIGPLARETCTPPAPDADDSLPILISLLAKPLARLPRCGPAGTFRTYQLQRIGRVILGLGATCLCAGLALAIGALNETEEVLSRSRQHLSRQQRSVTELSARRTVLQSLPLPSQTSSVLVEHLSTHMLTASPLPALHALATALAGLPTLDIQRIDWAPSAPASSPATTAAHGETLSVEFRLPKGPDHLHDRVQQSAGILTALRAIPGARITTERLPAELDPRIALRATDLLAPQEAPLLGVRIQFPPRP